MIPSRRHESFTTTRNSSPIVSSPYRLWAALGELRLFRGHHSSTANRTNLDAGWRTRRQSRMDHPTVLGFRGSFHLHYPAPRFHSRSAGKLLVTLADLEEFRHSHLHLDAHDFSSLVSNLDRSDSLPRRSDGFETRHSSSIPSRATSVINPATKRRFCSDSEVKLRRQCSSPDQSMALRRKT